jgi:hypothetical protein
VTSWWKKKAFVSDPDDVKYRRWAFAADAA